MVFLSGFGNQSTIPDSKAKIMQVKNNAQCKNQLPLC